MRQGHFSNHCKAVWTLIYLNVRNYKHVELLNEFFITKIVWGLI